MIHKTFIHTLSNGEKAKFTIQSKFIENKTWYFANVISIKILEELPEHEQMTALGVKVSNGTQKTVYYKGAEKLKF